jgi:hypothetical protein
MSQYRSVTTSFDFKAVSSIETSRQASLFIELKHDPLAGGILGDLITNGSVPTSRTDNQPSIEPHGGPSVMGPESIVGARESVNEWCDLRGGSRQEPFMNVSNFHDSDFVSEALPFESAA